jgi:RHS repeat-associated protein
MLVAVLIGEMLVAPGTARMAAAATSAPAPAVKASAATSSAAGATVALAATDPDDVFTPKPVGSEPAKEARRDIAQGTTYGVSQYTGAFTTEIPLWTPPGRLGVEPKLALRYSSLSNAPGVVGAGWELSLPMIDADGRNVSPTDQGFRLSGQRLVTPSGGAIGTHFQTEQDSYSQIARSCPAWMCQWLVIDKKGIRTSFGTTSDSRLGPASVGVSGVSRVEDPSGNYMTVSYMTDADLAAQFGAGYGRFEMLLPKQIRYTGGAGLEPGYTVRFGYELRADPYTYQTTGGAPAKLAYRLASVTTVGADNVIIRRYRLEYRPSWVTGRTLLYRVHVDGLGGVGSPQPIVLNYKEDAAPGFAAPTSVALTNRDQTAFGDFTGDGRQDMLTYTWEAKRWTVYPGSDTGLGAGQTWRSNHEFKCEDQMYVGDWDADGDDDVFHYQSPCGSRVRRWYVLVSSGASFGGLIEWVNGGTAGLGAEYDRKTGRLVFADVDRDGRTDALMDRVSVNEADFAILSKANANNHIRRDYTHPIPHPMAVADLDGNRGVDLLVRGTSGYATYCGNPSGSEFVSCRSTFALPPGDVTETALAGDYNGDGWIDVALGSGTSTTRVFLNPGSEGNSYVSGTASVGHPLAPSATGDVDGDGRDDIVRVHTTSSSDLLLRTWLRRGDAFVEGSTAGWPDVMLGNPGFCVAPARVTLSDMTGDGRADAIVSIIGQSPCEYATAKVVLSRPGVAVDRLASITLPSGMLVAPTYDRKRRGTVWAPVVSQLVTWDFPRASGRPVLETRVYTYEGGRLTASTGEMVGFSFAYEDVLETGLRTATAFNTWSRSVAGKVSSVARGRTGEAPLTNDYYEYRSDTTAPYRTELSSHVRAYMRDWWYADHRTLETFSYDDRGNVTDHNDYGFCGNPDDDRVTHTDYATGAAYGIYDRAIEIMQYQGGTPTPTAENAEGCTAGPAARLMEATRFEYDGRVSWQDQLGTAHRFVDRGVMTRISRFDGDPDAVLEGAYRPHRTMTHLTDGRLSTWTDGAGATTTVEAYDPVLGTYPARVRSAEGLVVNLEYEPHFGLESRRVDPNGQVTTTTYEPFGRVATVRTPGSQTGIASETYVYGDGTPAWKAKVVPYQAGAELRASASLTFYDALGRTLMTVADSDRDDELRVTERATYLASGKQVAATWAPVEVAKPRCGGTATCLAQQVLTQPATIDYLALRPAGGAITTYAYDVLGRMTGRSNPDGSAATFVHAVTSGDGFTTTSTDEVGDKKEIARDVHGDIAWVRQWTGAGGTGDEALTSYTRDGKGRLTEIYDPLGNLTALSWDLRGRLVGADSPSSGLIYFEYDEADRETSRIDARGVNVQTQYDGLGRIVARWSGTTLLARYAYDDDPLCAPTCQARPATSLNTQGRAWGRWDPNTTVTYAYDGDGNLVREAYGDARGVLTYQHIANGQRVTTTGPDNIPVVHGRGPDGSEVSQRRGAAQVALGYDAFKRPLRVDYGNGAVTQYAYHPTTSRLSSIATTAANASKVLTLTYTHDLDGSIASIARKDWLANTDVTKVLTHDSLKRIREVTRGTTVVESYSYDVGGRMLASLREDGVTTYDHDDPEHPLAVTGVHTPTRSTLYGYDAAGSRISREIVNDIYSPTTYQYDHEGRLVFVNPMGTTNGFLYNPDGTLAAEAIEDDNERTYHVGDYTISWPDTQYVGYTARFGDLTLGVLGTGGSYYHLDHLGSVTAITNGTTGQVTARPIYDAFGDVLAGPTSWVTYHGYNGRQLVTDGLYHYGARYYDTYTATFTQPDTALYGFDSPETLNAYAYAVNSPYHYTDPSGHFIVPLVVGLFTVATIITLEGMQAQADPNYEFDWKFVLSDAAMLALSNMLGSPASAIVNANYLGRIAAMAAIVRTVAPVTVASVRPQRRVSETADGCIPLAPIAGATEPSSWDQEMAKRTASGNAPRARAASKADSCGAQTGRPCPGEVPAAERSCR